MHHLKQARIIRCQIKAAGLLRVCEELGYKEVWPAVMQVDNAAALSFQMAKKGNTKLQSVYNLRENWVHELRDDSNIVTKK